MTEPNQSELTTRDRVLQLLSEGEFAGVGNGSEDTLLRRGEQYLDLEHLALGVQRSDGTSTATAGIVPRNAIHEDTWRRILRQLKPALPTPT
jgi:hypothetical protein